jgi:hypothetical protein
MNEGSVVAIIELKSQVGSFGNNLNNRIEEMMGQSLDIWRATKENSLGPMRPWFGYVMILEADAKSTRLQKPKKALLPVDSVFNKSSYVEQYSIALDRLRLEGDMNAVCLATTSKLGDVPVTYPQESMTFNRFARSLHHRIMDTMDAPETRSSGGTTLERRSESVRPATRSRRVNSPRHGNRSGG